MSQRGLAGLIGAIFLVVLALDSYFIVSETERAVLKRFQEIVRTDIEPDIHFKLPFIDQVVRVDARAQVYEIPTQSYLTSERKLMDVSSFVIWRVVDVQRYVTVIGGGAANNSDRMRDIAQQRLNVRVAERLRNEVAQRTVQEVVAGRMEVLTDAVNTDQVPLAVVEGDVVAPVIAADEAGELSRHEDAREQLMVNVLREIKQDVLDDFGIEVVDVRVKQVDWPDEVRSRVFDRMRAERARDASRHRSEGREGAEKIRAAAERERTVILAQGYRDAELIRGDGDAEAAGIYARLYDQDREFFRFYRSLQAYRNTFRDRNDLMVLHPEGDFFRYLNSSRGR